MIKILADKNLHKIEQFVPANCQLDLYDPTDGLPELDGYNALLIRTVTKLHKQTVPHLPASLSFIGTGSAGTDHIDIPYLQSQDIQLVDAKGCNARAVAEYIMTALLLWKEHNQLNDFGTIGIIGAGKTGTAVSQMLHAFNIDYVLYDPPRAESEKDFNSASLDEVLSCDILTFHVPLTKNGRHPTYHWLKADRLNGSRYKLVINASRGGVVNEEDLKRAYMKGTVTSYILDVWENEPSFNADVAASAFIATPHIAGYSEQAKLNASRVICEKLGDHFNLHSDKTYQSIPHKVDLAHIEYDLPKLLSRLHPILEYDRALRDLANRDDKAKLFRSLRTDWPYRFEYPMIHIRKKLLQQHEPLAKLGITEIELN